MPAIWGSIIGGGLGLIGNMMAPDQQTTTQQNYPSPFLTGRPGTGPGGFDPAYGGHNLLASINNLLGGNMGAAETGAGREGVANDALFNRGQSQNPLTGAGANYIQNILGGGGFQPGQNPWLNAKNQGATGNTLGTASSIIGGQGLSPDTNPYLKMTFNRAADATQGRLASEFARGNRDLGASRPARSDELQTLASNIYGGNYQAERGRQANMTGQSLGLGQQNLGNQRGIYNQGMGMALNQQMGALGTALPFANQDYTNINAMIQAANNPVNNLINRIGAIAPAAGGTATQTNPVYNDPFSAGLGGAMMGGFVGQNWPWNNTTPVPSSGGGGRSDIRLKENIQKLGTTVDGFNTYTWDWNETARDMGIDEPTVGFMAQEVQKVRPDVIGESDGYLTINYGAL